MISLGCALCRRELLRVFPPQSMRKISSERIAKIGRAREIAFDVLLRVETREAFSDDLLHARLEERVSAMDAALSMELTLGTLRWQKLLDFLIDRALAKSGERLDAQVRIALRLGLYQLRFLDKIPARAAVNGSVELIKRSQKRSAASLVNAVLRRLAEGDPKKDAESFIAQDCSITERLGIIYSHSAWLVERWIAAFGVERTKALLEANNRPARTACVVLDLQQRVDVIGELEGAGLAVRPGALLREALIVSGGAPTRANGYRNGEISLLDEASQAIAFLVGAQKGQSVLDLCAAPGGKTTLLARAAGAEGKVTACDIYAHRLRAVEEQMKRTCAKNVTTIALDGTKPLPFDAEFDRVLVDAPCSGTGTLSPHPEIRWRLRLEDLDDLHSRQVRLLRNALSAAKRGGIIVYSTCSLEAEENEMVVREAIEGLAEYRILNAKERILPHLVEGLSADDVVDASGFFRTFPPRSGTDGFFAAVVERSS